MPNHVTSICTVTGPAVDVSAFYEKHVAPGYPARYKGRDVGPAFSCDTVFPMPEILQGTTSPPPAGDERAAKAYAETGFTDWYDWSCETWGTKWGTYDFEERERGDGRYVFKFESAWSFPTPVFAELANRFPSLVFDVVTYDEGHCFGGEGQFNGRNDFRCSEDLAIPRLYEAVYGHPEPQYDADGNEIPADSESEDK